MLARKLWLLNQLRRNCRAPAKELERIQLSRLRSLLNHAYQNVPYYRRKFREMGILPEDIKSTRDLKKLPILDKKQLQEDERSFIAVNYNINRLSKARTSGSTGIPLNIYFDGYAVDYKDALRYRALIENGFRFTYKSVDIGDPRSFPKENLILSFFGILKKTRISVYDDYKTNFQKLNLIKPDVITSYSSVLRLFANEIKSGRTLEFKPKLVFSIAEMLSSSEKNQIKDAFGCDVIDLYGSTEFDRLSWECSEHLGYHMDVDSAVIEFVKDGENVLNERGDIVVTCLYNKAMPFIRYRLGDTGINKDEMCRCGRTLPLMTSIEGRSDDLITLPSGKKISPRSINVIRHLPGIKEYSITQEKLDRFVVRVIPNLGFHSKTKEEIKKEILSIFGDESVEVYVTLVDSIPRSKSGKMRAIVSIVNDKNEKI
ncbi:MAG: hypothetical protein QXK37_03170 [Candidatus Woesearchaeota archaeon]